MRKSIMFGMVAGGIIGAAAAMVAMPYIQPEVKRAMRKGKKAISHQFEKMMGMFQVLCILQNGVIQLSSFES